MPPTRSAPPRRYQRSRPVDAFNKHRSNSNPTKWRDAFYKNNATNFFKDRKWLQQEFPLLERVTLPDAGEVRTVELGCGAGNTLFPVLRLKGNSGFTSTDATSARRPQPHTNFFPPVLATTPS